LAEIYEMLAAYQYHEERLSSVIAFGVNFGFTGKAPQRTSRAGQPTDREHLLKMMRGEIDAQPVQLTPEVVQTVFARDIIGARKIDILAPTTEPGEDPAADLAYLKKLDRLMNTEERTEEN